MKLILGFTYLSQIASVRRSLFNNAERGKFLNQLVTGVREILNNPTGLQDPNNYHEFCRSVHELFILIKGSWKLCWKRS